MPHCETEDAAPRWRNSGWVAVAVLVAAYAVSFLDRQIVSLLVDPIKHDLALSDTQIGLLQGPAFGIFYAVLGLPLGWLADRIDRVRLIAAAIFLWSSMTICCGLATGFAGLLAGRFGVGVGEAALVPAAISLLADRFAPARRALPMSIFTAGISIGAGLSLALGGFFIGYAQHGVSSLPVVGPWLATLRSWQTVFILVGASGLPLVAVVSLLADARRETAGDVQSGTVLRYLANQRELFVPLFGATACLYILSNALSAWFPSLFVRQFGWTPKAVGETVGIWIMTCAAAGNVSSGALTNLLARSGTIGAPLRTMLLGACLMLPLGMLLFLLPTAPTAMAGIVALYFATALTFGIATNAFAAVTPAALRGQVVAIYLLIGNLVGFSVGPVSVGLLIDHATGPLAHIGPALSLVCTASAIPAIVLLLRARPAFANNVIRET